MVSYRGQLNLQFSGAELGLKKRLLEARWRGIIETMNNKTVTISFAVRV
jgi:hypothetical protein